MDQNKNQLLPYILINIDITLSSSQLKQKLIDEMIASGERKAVN